MVFKFYRPGSGETDGNDSTSDCNSESDGCSNGYSDDWLNDDLNLGEVPEIFEPLDNSNHTGWEVDFDEPDKEISNNNLRLPRDSIMAFSTIATMLSLIKRGTQVKSSPPDLSVKQGQQLRILNALSILFVRDVEVVSVVGNVVEEVFIHNLRSKNL